MKRSHLLSSVALALFLVLAPPTIPAPVVAQASQVQGGERKEVTVWVNTKSGIYWCPGSRWYGRTKQGKYMGECEALEAGYRPAYHRPCGSDCGK
jgi:hypothetical protein